MTVLYKADVDFLSEVSAWMYSFVMYDETEEEAEDSMMKLKDVIIASADGDVRKSLVKDTSHFVETKFANQLIRMGKWNYMMKWSGWVGENCFTKSSNAALSECVFSPKPKMHVHQSADCIIQHAEEVYR